MTLSASRRNSGFTLIELMVTLAVAAILLAAATPSFADFIDKARLKGAADDVVSFMADARAGSVKRNRDTVVAFGGSVSAWCIGANGAADPNPIGAQIQPAQPCDCTTASSCTVGGLQKTLLSTGYKGVALDVIPAPFTFDSRLGSVYPLGTTAVTLTSPQARYYLQVNISPLGQANLCVPSGKRAVAGYASC